MGFSASLPARPSSTNGVRWNDGVSGLTLLANGTPVGGFVGDSTSLNCGGANPATIQVNLSNAAISAAPTGAYSDTLTIMITPP